MRKVKLPSGAELTIQPAPFVDAKNLYQALLKELKGVHLVMSDDMGNLFKEMFCAGFSSPYIESCLWKCLERCTYDNGKNGALKIVPDTFEPIEARQDFMVVCAEVVMDNVGPFVKTLFADSERFSQMIKSTRK